MNDRPKLTNNYEMAVSRLKNTEKRLLGQRATGEVYKTIIGAYQEKGYIRKVENRPREKESVDGVWYLPHSPVCRPDKSTTKTRIVFDASAKFNGTSFNDEIHPGPKLQNSLFDVLIRFRRYLVAVVCDIKEMYLQSFLPVQDRPFFRFLWRDLEPQREPKVYEFARLVFGDASAPFRAQLVSQKNARIHEEEFPIAAETIKESTYMDDSLDSVKTADIAVELYHQLTALWEKAGMEPRKWLSNFSVLLAEIPKDHLVLPSNLTRTGIRAKGGLDVTITAFQHQFHGHRVKRFHFVIQNLYCNWLVWN